MAVITSGKTFANGEQLSASKLNQVITAATFNQADAVDGSTMTIIGGAMAVAEGGIATAKIADDAVTAAKIAAGALTDVVYPVGSIFTTVTNYANSAAVVNAIGGTTWVAFGAGRVLVGQNSSDSNFNTVEETGGASTVTLDIDEMPSHRHGGIQPSGSAGSNSNGFDVDGPANGADTDSFQKFTKYAGGSGSDANGTLTSAGDTQAHNNLQPYIVVYMWKRTD